LCSFASLWIACVGKLEQAREDLGFEAFEHGRGELGRVRPEVGRAQHVPAQRPVERRVVEAGERAVDSRDGAAEARERLRAVLGAGGPRRAGQPRQEARRVSSRAPIGSMR
jgi:hypothetical protein